MGIALSIAVMVSAIVGVLVWRGRQVGALARDGVPVQGIVSRKFRSGSGKAGARGRRIAFTYRGPDGVDYRRAASVTASRWAELEEGGPIDLVYLPARPGVSAPAWMIDHAREALKPGAE